MKTLYRNLLLVIAIVAVALTSCAAPATPAATAVPAAETWTIYTPASTSSIPVIMAAKKLDNVELVLFTNQEQANTLFARGEVSVMVTGLSVGMALFKNEIPVKLDNTYVSGLSYLVTYGKTVASFSDLKGGEIYIPFAGSPIEEICQYLAAQEGLTWGTDITPIYSPFDASIALLKEGKAVAVVLPEPNVSLVESQPDVYISFSLYDLWNQYNPESKGYPQVGTFVNADWAASHPTEVEAFNTALAEAIQEVQADPAAAVAAIKDQFKLPEPILTKALSRTQYQFYAGTEMQERVEAYYQTVGKPLDETFTQFYYIPAK
jgi:NitT/TauT family transport system substrate-binding protein